MQRFGKYVTKSLVLSKSNNQHHLLNKQWHEQSLYNAIVFIRKYSSEKARGSTMELNKKAITELITKMADDALIIGHRNSEWVGIGPTLEEDIAFASIAQDKIGQALQLYTILHEHCGTVKPDHFAFLREERDYRCCHFVEIPMHEYDVALMRHFLFDTAESLRFSALVESSFEPLAQVAKKFRGEIKYHTLHANVWITQLGNGNEESKARMQSALNECMPLALGVFEQSQYEEHLIGYEMFIGEDALYNRWIEAITPILTQAGLTLPNSELYVPGQSNLYRASIEPAIGGRRGYHTEYLQTLLDEMSEVLRTDPEATW
jgi:ring-1,2-phenylacetyl-CoA epoxidase subunit PaaC